MTTFAYVDSSGIVASALEEPSSRLLVARLKRFEQVLSSSLLEAEYPGRRTG